MSNVDIVRGTGTLSSGAPSGYGAAHAFTLQAAKVTRFREYTDLGGPFTG